MGIKNTGVRLPFRCQRHIQRLLRMISTPCLNRTCIVGGVRRLGRHPSTSTACNSSTGAEAQAPRRTWLPTRAHVFAPAPTRYSDAKFISSSPRSLSSCSILDDDVHEVKVPVDGDGVVDDKTTSDLLSASHEHLREGAHYSSDTVEESTGDSSDNALKLNDDNKSSSANSYSKRLNLHDNHDPSELEALTKVLVHLEDVEQTGDSNSHSSIYNDANRIQLGEESTQSSKPSLSELLQTDIFTKSWAEPDIDREESMHRRSDVGTFGRRSFRLHQSENRHSALHSSYSVPAPKEIPSTTLLHDGEINIPNQQSPQRQQSPAEIEHSKLLDQTNNLLEAITSGDTTTLQLMDFDKVMTQWSRFHVEACSDNNLDLSLKRNASDQCMRLLDALERNYDYILDHALDNTAVELPPMNNFRLLPNAASYNLALNTLANSGKGKKVASEAYFLLLRMLDRCQSYTDIVDSGENRTTFVKLPPQPFEPTSITFNSTIHAIAKSGAPDSGHLAERVFCKMIEWRRRCEERKARNDVVDNESNAESYMTPSTDFYSPDNSPTCSYCGVVPNSRTLACVIDAWANTKDNFAPERAEAILQLAIKNRLTYVDSLVGRCPTNRDSSTNHQQEWRDAFMEDSGVEEQAVVEDPQLSLLSMVARPLDIESTSLTLKPNTVAFNTCIHAWATSGRGREGALRAQELLVQLESLSESGDLDLPIDHHSGNSSDGKQDIDTSLKPNVRTYSLVMNAWANMTKAGKGSGEDAASHCEDILTKMEVRGAIDASIRPNLVAYVTSISAWANTKGVEHAASKAEHILNRMIDLYYNEDTSELPHIDGDVENANHDAPFNSVITAYARSSDPNAAERALAVLERLEASPIQPSATSYNAAMDVCAKHGQPDRALEVLEKMKKMSIAADATSYDTILNAFARHDKAGSAERAYEFLCELEQSSSVSQFSPSVWSYATVINAFARASGKEYGGLNAVEKARDIYNELVDKMANGLICGEVDCYANSCLLNCCANMYGTRAERRAALVIAVNAFEDMKQKPYLHGDPNQYTYGTMMKVCIRLSSDNAEKHRLMESLSIQACKSGNVSKAVLDQFCRHTPNQLHMKVILSQGGTKREIPWVWYKNVPRRQWPTAMENDAWELKSSR